MLDCLNLSRGWVASNVESYPTFRQYCSSHLQGEYVLIGRVFDVLCMADNRRRVGSDVADCWTGREVLLSKSEIGTLSEKRGGGKKFCWARGEEKWRRKSGDSVNRQRKFSECVDRRTLRGGGFGGIRFGELVAHSWKPKLYAELQPRKTRWAPKQPEEVKFI
jgi:hypothetical protein